MGRYVLNTATGTASPAVYVKQYDRGYTLDFEIHKGTDIFNLTGCTVLVNLLKPDNTEYVGIGEITSAIDGYVSVRLDSDRQMTAVSGWGTLELVIIKGGESQGTANARLIIQESPGSSVVSGTVVDGLVALAADVASAVSTCQSAASSAGSAAQSAIAAKDEAQAIALGDIRDIIFPVGSIVQYADASIDPNTLIGGTWERIQGRFLFGADSNHAIGTEGGSETQTLTAANLPRHMHYTIRLGMSGQTSPDYLHTVARSDLEHAPWENARYQLYGVDAEANAGRSSYVGNGTAHNNMPPYIAVYIWKRTA